MSFHLESSIPPESELLKLSPEFFRVQSKCMCCKQERQTIQGQYRSRSTKFLSPKSLAPSIIFDSQHSPYPASFPRLLKMKSYTTFCGKKIPERWSHPCYYFSSWKWRKWCWWETTALGVCVNTVTAALGQSGHGEGSGAGCGLSWPTDADTHQPINTCLHVCSLQPLHGLSSNVQER